MQRITNMHYIYGLYKKNVSNKECSLSKHLFYIGIASNNINLYHREKNHRKEKSNPYKLNIIAKYDFELKVLWQVNTKEEAIEREEFLIRWFGRKKDGGILTNILSSNYDLSLCHRPKSKATKNKISKALKKINQKQEIRIANRDRNLTKPHNEIINLIEKWSMNPLESQQSFANRHNVSRSKFKDWIRLYKPEYIGLTKKKHLEIFNSITNKNQRRKKDIIQEYKDKSGLTLSQSKAIVYRFWNKNESL